MLTIEALASFGANTKEGLARCLNNEAFYLRLVKMAATDQNFARLNDAILQNDRKAAFEAAHALKGVLGNLSLTALQTPVSEMTELLRADTDADYGAYLSVINEKHAKLLQLIDSESKN